MIVLFLFIATVASSCSPACTNCVNDTLCLACQDGYWNQHCIHVCPRRCGGAGDCDRDSGRCFSCQDGYYGSECDQRCPVACLRADHDLRAIIGGPCIAVVANASDGSSNNVTVTDMDMTETETTESSTTTTTSIALRTPLPTNEDLPLAVRAIVCTIGCNPGLYSPIYSCVMTCPTSCAPPPANETWTAATCVPVAGQPLDQPNCQFGCRYPYGGPSCSVYCRLCAPTTDGQDACDANGVCRNGCLSGQWGDKCTEYCGNSCAAAGCDQETGECFACKDNRCGAKCMPTDACANPSNCTPVPMAESPYRANCGPCIVGYWGSLCENACDSNCLGVCDKKTGACLGECRGAYFGERCEKGPVLNCAEASRDGQCKICAVFSWGEQCEKSCPYNCDWTTSSSVSEVEVIRTACARDTGECTIGCSQCKGEKITLWVMLSIFVFLPVLIGTVYFSVWCCVRRRLAAEAEEGAAKPEAAPSSSS